jgi:cyclase
MRLATRLSSLFAACLLGGIAAAQSSPDFGKVDIRSERLADNLYMLTGAGGNMALLVGSEGAVLVDAEFAALAPRIQAAIARITDGPVRFVFNTHFHADHTGGNAAFAAAGSVIIAHDNVLKRLSTRPPKAPPAPRQGLPLITFGESMSLHLDGEDIDALHLPRAHTDGDVVLYFRKANVMHTGDVFAGPSYPIIDRNGGGSINGLIAGLATITRRVRPDTRIVPGHAPVATRADVEALHDMLVVVRERIAALVKARKTEAEVVAAHPTQEFDARYGSGPVTPDAFVRAVYADLKRK